MRLLHTETGRFYYTYLPVRGSYAILSHAETTRNTTYQQMLSIQARTTEGTALEDDELEGSMIKNFCRVAAGDGFKYCWIYPSCVDKTNSSEMSEAVVAHYDWYRCSGACYALISNVESMFSL